MIAWFLRRRSPKRDPENVQAAKIIRFAALMAEELDANVAKGGWSDYDPAEMVHDLAYHVAKLAIAVAQQNPQAIREYAADVGNEAMIVADLTGSIRLPPARYPTYIQDVIADKVRDHDEETGSGSDPDGEGSSPALELKGLAKTFAEDAVGMLTAHRFYEVYSGRTKALDMSEIDF